MWAITKIKQLFISGLRTQFPCVLIHLDRFSKDFTRCYLQKTKRVFAVSPSWDHFETKRRKRKKNTVKGNDSDGIWNQGSSAGRRCRTNALCLSPMGAISAQNSFPTAAINQFGRPQVEGLCLGMPNRSNKNKAVEGTRWLSAGFLRALPRSWEPCCLLAEPRTEFWSFALTCALVALSPPSPPCSFHEDFEQDLACTKDSRNAAGVNYYSHPETETIFDT